MNGLYVDHHRAGDRWHHWNNRLDNCARGMWDPEPRKSCIDVGSLSYHSPDDLLINF